LSGSYEDPLDGVVTVGAGQLPLSLDDVQVAPNGQWLALDSSSAGSEIHAIDPVSGDRTVVYAQAALAGTTAADGDGPGICKIDGLSLQVAGHVPTTPNTGAANFVVAADGTIYARASRGTNELEGVVALKDGACTVLSLYSAAQVEAFNVAGGPSVNTYYAWLVEDGDRLLSASSQVHLHAIAKATGARSTVSAHNPDGMLGSGPMLGDDYAVLSGDGATLFTTGPDTEGGVVAVELATGDRTLFPRVKIDSAATAASKGPLELHPTLDGVLIVAPEGGLMFFEPATGNYMNFSR
jgi:hypothetical protein